MSVEQHHVAAPASHPHEKIARASVPAGNRGQGVARGGAKARGRGDTRRPLKKSSSAVIARTNPNAGFETTSARNSSGGPSANIFSDLMGDTSSDSSND